MPLDNGRRSPKKLLRSVVARLLGVDTVKSLIVHRPERPDAPESEDRVLVVVSNGTHSCESRRSGARKIKALTDRIGDFV
jgi:hypothetical protein